MDSMVAAIVGVSERERGFGRESEGRRASRGEGIDKRRTIQKWKKDEKFSGSLFFPLKSLSLLRLSLVVERRGKSF